MKQKPQSLDDICIWHKVMTDPNSTTRIDAMKDPNSDLRRCPDCLIYDIHATCPNYKSIKALYDRKPNEQYKKD